MVLRMSRRGHEVSILQSQMEADLTRVIYSGRFSHLTYIEVMQSLNSVQASVLKYALRQERHPDDPEKRADEDCGNPDCEGCSWNPESPDA